MEHRFRLRSPQMSETFRTHKRLSAEEEWDGRSDLKGRCVKVILIENWFIIEKSHLQKLIYRSIRSTKKESFLVVAATTSSQLHGFPGKMRAIFFCSKAVFRREEQVEAEVTERQVVEPTKLLPVEKCLLRTNSCKEAAGTCSGSTLKKCIITQAKLI